MPPRSALWPINPHTAAKHSVLRKYLDRWLPIMATQRSRLALIDGFAGPAVYEGGEPGSPRIMIDAFAQHARRQDIERQAVIEYHFVESNQARFEHLTEQVAQAATSLPRQWPVPELLRADFGVAVRPIVDALGADGVPTFLFIDPFGYMDPPPDLGAKLLGYAHTETLTFVPTNYLSRFISDEAQARTFDNFFGRPGWRRARGGSARQVADILVGEYSDRLHDDALWVRNFEFVTDEGQLYHLFFATNNERGYQKMKEAMWAVDPHGGTRFLDTTVPGQSVLFSETADLGLLEQQLRARFPPGEWHRYDAMERFTWFETAYLDRHLRADLARLKVERKVGIINEGPRGGLLPDSLVTWL